MPRYPLLGPSNPLIPTQADLERIINRFPEVTAPGTPKVGLTGRLIPGRHVATVVSGANSVDVLFDDGSASPGLTTSAEGRCFFVAESVFGELVDVSGTISQIIWGSVAPSTLPGQQTSIASNGDGGHQLFIVSGGNGYIFNLVTSAFGLIADADFPQGNAGIGVFLDGYFIVLNYTDSSFQLSALNDGTSWDALDVAQRSDASDRMTSIAVFRNDLWLFGSQTYEVWTDTGAANFPFERIQGSLQQYGVIDVNTIQIFDNALWFVGQQHASGQPDAFMARGYEPTKVSTQALSNILSAVDRTAGQVRAWTYTDKGHAFYVIRMPEGTTWAYDLTSQLWHERGIAVEDGEPDEYDPDPIRSHVFQFNQHLVGDSTTGTIWQMSSEFLDDEVAV